LNRKQNVGPFINKFPSVKLQQLYLLSSEANYTAVYHVQLLNIGNACMATEEKVSCLLKTFIAFSRAVRSLLLYRRAHTTHEMETRSNDWDGKPVSSAIACIHLVGFFLGKILSTFP
jgi:hypothetical protein